MLHHSLFPRKLAASRHIIVISLLCALGCGLVFALFSTLAIRHQHQHALNRLALDTQVYFTDYFAEVTRTAASVVPLLSEPCNNAIPLLTKNAAFNPKIRTLVLVNNGEGYCSSGTGNTQFVVKQYVPELNTASHFDASLVAGTFMLPNHPSLVMWSRAGGLPDRGVMTTLSLNLTAWLLYQPLPRADTNIALVVKDYALSTWNNRLIHLRQLPANADRTVVLKPWNVSLKIYRASWSPDERWQVILGTLLTALAAGLICCWFLSHRHQPGRAIITAIKRRQFWVAYQPVIETKSGQIAGTEALMRWDHPIAGAIRPDLFIATAEAHQLIIPLTRHLFSLIAADAPALMQALPPGAKIGVNLAPSHLYSPSFKQDILDFAASLPADYFRIVFEITERDMLKEKEAIALFEWLHQQGFEIAVDDFGTGHSALIYLERFTLDYLKIDRGFIKTIGVETVTSPVLDAVLSLAERLKMTTVAEGVETDQQAQWLIQRGVDYLQGYLYARPLSVAAFIEHCQRQPGRQPHQP